MNNLNNLAGIGDWDPWKYALLVPMLAVGACRWSWKRESQREIQKIKAQCDEDVSTIKSEMEAQHLKAMATLQLELDKERQRLKERMQLEQRKNLEVWSGKIVTILMEREKHKPAKEAISEGKSSLTESDNR